MCTSSDSDTQTALQRTRLKSETIGSYFKIESDAQIGECCAGWAELGEIAVDTEYDCNFHSYGIHLGLIQIYDGTDFYIIDPLSREVTLEGLRRFFEHPVEKVWFDARGDSSIVKKLYHFEIANVFDLFSFAGRVGFSGNLYKMIENYLGTVVEINKKKNQRTNWLKRPINPGNLEYALLDVRYLIELKRRISAEFIEKNPNVSIEEFKRMCAKSRANTRIDKVHRPPYWSTLSRSEKKYAAALWKLRDEIARSLNIPVGFFLQKQVVTDLAVKRPKTKEELGIRLRHANKRLSNAVIDKFWAVFEKPETENESD
ncbi:HRDC domain-containing protein [bacterium]|nr:HRDC domain-containing protein [bacterium]